MDKPVRLVKHEDVWFVAGEIGGYGHTHPLVRLWREFTHLSQQLEELDELLSLILQPGGKARVVVVKALNEKTQQWEVVHPFASEESAEAYVLQSHWPDDAQLALFSRGDMTAGPYYVTVEEKKPEASS